MKVHVFKHKCFLLVVHAGKKVASIIEKYTTLAGMLHRFYCVGWGGRCSTSSKKSWQAPTPKGIFSNPEIFKILIHGGGGGDRNLYIRKTKEDISVVFIHISLVRTEDQRRHSNREYSYISLNFFSVINIVDRVRKLLYFDWI